MIPVLGICGNAGSGKDLVADWFVQKRDFVKIAFADEMKYFMLHVFAPDDDAGTDDFIAALWGPSELRELPIILDQEHVLKYTVNMAKFMNQFINSLCISGEDRIKAYLDLINWFEGLRTKANLAYEVAKLTDPPGLRKFLVPALPLREFLQTLGTEWGRKVNPLLWVNYLYKETVHKFTKEKLSEYNINGIIVPDHRFANEVAGTQQFGGYVIRLRRPAKEGVPAPGIPGHASETQIKDMPDSAFDLVLEMPEGIDNVYAILDSVYKEQAWEKKRQGGGLAIDSIYTPPQSSA